MKKRIIGLALGAVLFVLCASAQAQQPNKIPRIGFVLGSGNPKSLGPSVEAFRRGLRDLGYIEGQNILIEYRYAEGNVERIPTLVSELVQLKVNVLFVTTLIGILAAKQGTQTIPVVMVTTQDPVATGISIAWRARAETLRGSQRSPET